jgi:hypothetical protein
MIDTVVVAPGESSGCALAGVSWKAQFRWNAKKGDPGRRGAAGTDRRTGATSL